MSTQQTAERTKQKLLNKIIAKRKIPPKNTDSKTKQSEAKTNANSDTLTKMAIEEIFRETAKGAVRAEKAGPSGWLPCPLLKTNKRFLKTTIKSVITHNRRQMDRIAPALDVGDDGVHAPKRAKKSERELDAIIAAGMRRTPKFGVSKHCFRKVNKVKTIDACLDKSY